MVLIGRTKQLAKLAFAELLYHSGLVDLYRERAMKASAVVLLYHRIVEKPLELLDYSPSGMTIRREAFDAQMAYVKQHYQMVSLTELARLVSSQLPLADRLCAVSFDDGWRDNYTHAFPILRKYEIPCTIFLTTNFIDGTKWFWEERLKYVLGHIVQKHNEGSLSQTDEKTLRETLHHLQLGSLLDLPLPRLRRFLSALVTDLRTRSVDDRDNVMSELEQLLLLSSLREPRRFMNWDEVRKMAAAGVEFGAHTLTHANLVLCGADEADVEIRGSKAIIEHALKQACPLFAYTYGKNTPTVHELVERAGFTAAFTINPGLIRKGTDPWRLNRIDMYENVAPNLPFFACRALHLFQVY